MKSVGIRGPRMAAASMAIASWWASLTPIERYAIGVMSRVVEPSPSRLRPQARPARRVLVVRPVDPWAPCDCRACSEGGAA